MKNILFLGLIVSIFLNGNAFAQSDKPAKKERAGKKVASDLGFNTEGYRFGVAGCGLGSLVFEPGTNQIFAATTNGSFYSQTFGITFGTSNCNAQNSKTAQMEQTVFMHANLASLSKEAAQGEGQSLRAFAEMLGCSARFDKFAAVGRSNYDEIFSELNPELVLHKYKRLVLKDRRLSEACSRVRFRVGEAT